MATQREIKNRIKSVKSTRKITKTMEMVATAKMKKLQDRMMRSRPYSIKLGEIIENLKNTGTGGSDSPLIREPEASKKVQLIVVTGNRGLCGGFNTNVIETALDFKRDYGKESDKEFLLDVIGKKGRSYLNFVKEPIFAFSPNPEEKLTFEDAAKIAGNLIERFESGEVDEVYIASTRAVSSTTQRPAVTRLLPVTPPEKEEQEEASGFLDEYIFEPDPDKIFSSLLPLYVKVQLYISLIESGYSEQFARRVAMKNATDAATDMIKDLTIMYNRARQAKITTEIAEIVGGAEALD